LEETVSEYWNDRVKKLEPYIPGEQPRGRAFIKLNTNENPYPPSPKVLEAIRNAAGDELRRYPDPGCTELRRVIAEQYGVKPEQVFVGNGSDEVLAFTFAAFFESTAVGALPILFPDITYSFYPVYAGLWDVPFKTVSLRDDFSINVDDYRVPAGGVIFPNPNAPTGIALSAEAVLSVAAYQDRVVVADEAYGAFAGTAQTGAVSVAPYIDTYPNLLTVHTLSKMGSLAGLRVGFAIGGEALIEGLCRVRDSFNSYPVDRIAQAGAAAAIADTAYYAETTRRVIATRERVSAALAGMGFAVLPSAANFIFVRLPGKSGAEFFAELRNRGILVRHFNKNRIADFLRVSIGTDDEMDTFLAECTKISSGKQ
jgi:histidinol-phosphate aminotransferase